METAVELVFSKSSSFLIFKDIDTNTLKEKIFKAVFLRKTILSCGTRQNIQHRKDFQYSDHDCCQHEAFYSYFIYNLSETKKQIQFWLARQCFIVVSISAL